MTDFDDFDDIFRRIQNMIDNEYTGGYRRIREENRGGNTRDNLIDIQEDDKYIYITVELKVRDEDLTVTPKEDLIMLEFMIDGTWQKWPIKLPAYIYPKSAKITFNNCVLDIQLKKNKEKNFNEQSRGDNKIPER